jgi:ribose-phosphate pyrophosphokinase
VEKIEESDLVEAVITDTIEPSEGVKGSQKINVLSISSLLGEAIKIITTGESISSLFT